MDDADGFEHEELRRNVDSFVAENGLEDAAESLLAAPAHVQRAVISRGGLEGARKPVNVLMARIRQAAAFAAPAAPRDGGGVYVKMRGLPFQATTEDILGFFDGHELDPESVSFGVAQDGRRTGEAFVEFPLEDGAKEAVEQKNMESVGGRYIELFFSTVEEAQRSCAALPPPPSGEGGAWGGEGDDGGYGASAEEVERFISSAALDERAADSLRALAPHQQRIVMDRGNLDNARNPSSVLNSRIKDVRRWEDVQQNVEAFLRDHPVDARAADSLRACEPEVQQEVMRRGIANARNPSSALLARIRDSVGAAPPPAGAAAPPPWAGAGPPPPGHYEPYPPAGPWEEDPPGPSRSLEQDAQDFVRDNAVDDRAAEAFLACPPWVQEAVMGRGGLQGTRNPSSVILSRIRDAQSGPPPANTNGHVGAPPVGAPPGLSGGVWGAAPAPHGGPPAHAGGRLGPPTPGPGLPPQPPGPAPPQMLSLPAGLVDDLEDYLHYRARDDTAAASLLGHIEFAKYGALRAPAPAPAPRDARRSGRAASSRSRDPRGRAPGEDPVEAFLRSNNVDAKAAEALRRCDPYVQGAVMDKGIAGARHPSSALLARIRDAEGMPHPRHGDRGPRGGDRPSGSRGSGSRGRGLADDVEAFLRANPVDEKAATALRRADPAAQREVVDRGIQGAKNPSSALQARLKDAESRGPRSASRRSRSRGRDRYSNLSPY